VRRLTGAPPTPPRAVAVAIRGYTPTAARPDELVIEFARGRYPAYAWAFPVAGGGANVGFGVFDRRGGGYTSLRYRVCGKLAAPFGQLQHVDGPKR